VYTGAIRLSENRIASRNFFIHWNEMPKSLAG
jgi:hypothetical protein